MPNRIALRLIPITVLLVAFVGLACGGGGGDAPEAKGDEAGQKKIAKKGEELKAEMDSLIEEIDEVLEENAEEFVKNYVQKGGQ